MSRPLNGQPDLAGPADPGDEADSPPLPPAASYPLHRHLQARLASDALADHPGTRPPTPVPPSADGSVVPLVPPDPGTDTTSRSARSAVGDGLTRVPAPPLRPRSPRRVSRSGRGSRQERAHSRLIVRGPPQPPSSSEDPSLGQDSVDLVDASFIPLIFHEVDDAEFAQGDDDPRLVAAAPVGVEGGGPVYVPVSDGGLASGGGAQPVAVVSGSSDTSSAPLAAARSPARRRRSAMARPRDEGGSRGSSVQRPRRGMSTASAVSWSDDPPDPVGADLGSAGSGDPRHAPIGPDGPPAIGGPGDPAFGTDARSGSGSHGQRGHSAPSGSLAAAAAAAAAVAAASTSSSSGRPPPPRDASDVRPSDAAGGGGGGDEGRSRPRTPPALASAAGPGAIPPPAPGTVDVNGDGRVDWEDEVEMMIADGVYATDMAGDYVWSRQVIEYFLAVSERVGYLHACHVYDSTRKRGINIRLHMLKFGLGVFGTFGSALTGWDGGGGAGYRAAIVLYTLLASIGVGIGAFLLWANLAAYVEKHKWAAAECQSLQSDIEVTIGVRLSTIGRRHYHSQQLAKLMQLSRKARDDLAAAEAAAAAEVALVGATPTVVAGHARRHARLAPERSRRGRGRSDSESRSRSHRSASTRRSGASSRSRRSERATDRGRRDAYSPSRHGDVDAAEGRGLRRRRARRRSWDASSSSSSVSEEDDVSVDRSAGLWDSHGVHYHRHRRRESSSAAPSLGTAGSSRAGSVRSGAARASVADIRGRSRQHAMALRLMQQQSFYGRAGHAPPAVNNTGALPAPAAAGAVPGVGGSLFSHTAGIVGGRPVGPAGVPGQGSDDGDGTEQMSRNPVQWLKHHIRPALSRIENEAPALSSAALAWLESVYGPEARHSVQLGVRTLTLDADLRTLLDAAAGGSGGGGSAGSLLGYGCSGGGGGDRGGGGHGDGHHYADSAIPSVTATTPSGTTDSATSSAGDGPTTDASPAPLRPLTSHWHTGQRRQERGDDRRHDAGAEEASVRSDCRGGSRSRERRGDSGWRESGRHHHDGGGGGARSRRSGRAERSAAASLDEAERGVHRRHRSRRDGGRRG